MTASALPFANEQFLAALFHDLRDPLAGVEMHAASLRRTPATAEGLERVHRRAEAIQRSAARARLLLQDLHELLRLQNGRLQLKVATVPVPALLDEAKAAAQPLLEERGSTLELLAPPASSVRCDRRRIQLVLRHLLANALVHGREPARVTLGATPHGDRVRFEVCDDGPGITPERQVDLFQVAPSRVRVSGAGLGLGLALSRGLVASNGGSLWLERTGPEGSAFAFTLPVEPSAARLVEG